MIKVSTKHRLLSAAVAVGAALAIAGPAIAQYHQGSDLLYEYYYYSDATYTDNVGYDRDTCNRWGVGRTATDGSSTPYV
ncbi:MAG TPA: hypothetical protein VGA98_05140 [Allosphingosinicella sp.]|jgi:hypothetical protein